MIRPGFGSGGRGHGGEVPFQLHRLRGYGMLTWVITGAGNLGHLVKMVSARSLHCKVTDFPSILWKWIIKFSPHYQGWELNSTSWRGESLHLEFLCEEDLSSPPHVFIHSFLYISVNWSCIYFIPWIRIQEYFIFLLKLAQLWPWDSFRLAPVFFPCSPILFLPFYFFSFNICLLSNTSRCSGLISYFPYPGSSISPGSPGPFC